MRVVSDNYHSSQTTNLTLGKFFCLILLKGRQRRSAPDFKTEIQNGHVF
jgi:hypothetical protein